MKTMSRLCLLASLTVSSAHASTLNIDIENTTVSGLSSGGYMATQFQLAHAEIVKGAGIVAAGPYYCAQNAITTALAECITTTTDEFSLAPLSGYIDQKQASNVVSDDALIMQQRVMVIRGTKDQTINQKASDMLVEQYKSLGIENITYIDDKAFAHVFPTINDEGKCDVSEPPFIGACDYDAAGEILQHLHGDLSAPTSANADNLITFSKHDKAKPEKAGMSDNAFAYVPSNCQDGEVCSVHISFHGCNQSSEDVGDAYATQTGFNRWAESNNMIVLYPQAKKSSLFPMNPQGCWDWWGYTDEKYATSEGQQIKTVRAMLDDLPTVFSRLN
ncbi:MAG: PHB depolymerase family esterase [Pseudomonadota bacterium]